MKRPILIIASGIFFAATCPYGANAEERTAVANTVSEAPTLEIIQTIRDGEEGAPKGWDYFTQFIDVQGDCVYAGGAGNGAGNGKIHYFKRDQSSGKMTYIDAVPVNTKGAWGLRCCCAGGRIYVKAADVVLWHEIEKETGKPVEKGKIELEKIPKADRFVVDHEGKNLYVCGHGAVFWYKIDADGTPVKAGKVSGGGIGFSTLRISPDGKNLYSIFGPHHAIAVIDRQATGEIAYRTNLVLDAVCPRNANQWHFHPSSIAGISPDGKWLYANLWSHEDVGGETYLIICKRDPATGELTIHESGSCWNSTRPDFRISTYRDLNLVFLPDGSGGFIGNTAGILQTFKFDAATGKLSDFADVREQQVKCTSTANVVLDQKNGLLYGGGPGWAQKNGVWVAKIGKGVGGNRSDIKATVASAEAAKPGSTNDPSSSRPKDGRDYDAASWPCWRGPNGDGKNPTKGIRKDWTGGLKKVWEVTGLSPVSCTWSSLSVKGNKLVVMGRHGVIDEVFCFDADKGGSPLWVAEFQDEYGDYFWGNGPASTPTIDGGKVYVASRQGKIVCLDMVDGKILWKKTAGMACHGYGNSSLVWDDLLIVPQGRLPDKKVARLAAYKKDTGELVWSYGEVSGGEDPSVGHVTPIRAKINGKEQIVYYTGTMVCGVDHLTGKPIWEFTPEKSWQAYCTACTPVTDGTIVYTMGIFGPLVVEVGADNTVKQPWMIKRNDKANWYVTHHSDSILKDGFLYTFTCMTAAGGISGNGGCDGDMRCVNLKTGEIKWVEKSYGRGTMLEVDGKLVCLTYAGDLLLVDPKPDGFKLVTEWKGGIERAPWTHHGGGGKRPAPFWTIPVVARGKLYVHYSDRLTCYDLMK